MNLAEQISDRIEKLSDFQNASSAFLLAFERLGIQPAAAVSALLAQAALTWSDKLTAEELDLISRLRYALDEIAEGKQ